MQKLICKVKDDNVCYGCIDRQIKDGFEKNCTGCTDNYYEGEILSFGHGLFVGDYAMVLRPDGRVERVPFKKIYDVKRAFIGIDFAKSLLSQDH